MIERPPATAPPLLRLILLGMTVLLWIVPLAGGVLLLGDAPLLGMVFIALGFVTLLLSIGRARLAILLVLAYVGVIVSFAGVLLDTCGHPPC